MSHNELNSIIYPFHNSTCGAINKVVTKPDYLKTLLEQIEAFADAEIFQEAVEEIRAGKNRSMDSLYAQQLRVYFGNSKLDLHEELKK